MNKPWVPSAGLFSLLWALIWGPLFLAVPYETAGLVGTAIFFGWVAGVVIVTVVRRKRARIAGERIGMAELGDKEREVWFRRVLWCYMPSHWKGVLYPAVIIAVAVPLYLLVDEYNSMLSLILLLWAWALVWWICERHSPSRQ